MPLIVIVTLVIAVVLLANALAAAKNPDLTQVFDVGLFLLNVPLAIIGLVVVFLPPELATVLQEQGGGMLTNLGPAGLSLVAMGVWGMAAALRPVRRLLARWLPFDPASPVHTLALAFCGYLVGNTLLTLTQGGLQTLAATAQSATVTDVVLQQALFVFLALFGVGLLVRRRGHAISHRLGLERPTAAQLRLGLRWIAILVAVQWLIGAAWTLLDPAQSELLDSISGQLFGDFDTVWEWFVLAMAAGMGEELLFRGALQPVFGLWFTSILFAIAHVQYGFTLVTVAVFIIGAALGYIRQRTNTSVAIFVHFGYNFVLGLLSMLAPVLERMAS